MTRIIAAKTAKPRTGAWLGTVSAMTLALIVGLTAASQPGAAQQIAKGGGDGGSGGGGGSERGGSGGIAGGGGGAARTLAGGGAASLDPTLGADRGHGSGGGEAGSSNDVSAGGGGGGNDVGGTAVGGKGGSGNVDDAAIPITLAVNKSGETGGASNAPGGGGGGGGLVLTGSGIQLATDGYDIAGGNGGSDSGVTGGGGGGGAGLVLIGGGTANVGASMITGGNGGDGGELAGQGGAGVFLYDGGTLNNNIASTIKGGAGGVGFGGGLGGTAVLSNQGSIDNHAALTGGAGGSAVTIGDGGGGGGAGIQAWGGAVTNRASGVISGGGGGSGDSGTAFGGDGGDGGSGVAFLGGQTAVLANHGTISGGDGGTALAGRTDGMGGIGVVGALTGRTTVINSGMIEGGLGADDTRADAVRFAGVGNRLELWAGYGFNGNVVAGSGDVLALGGATNDTFDASSLRPAAQYQGFGKFEKAGTSTWTLTGTNSFTGTTTINGGTLLAGNAGAFSANSATTINNGMLDLGGVAQTINTVNLNGGTLGNGSLTGAVTSSGGSITGLAGTATVTITGGTTSMNGTNLYTGATTVNGGVLDVLGSMDSSSLTVKAGATLTGNGSVGSTQVDANGMFVAGNGTPGSSMMVSSLALVPGAQYVVQLDPSTSSFANVTGTATLDGATVNAIYANGSYVAKRYTILSAGNVSGRFDDTMVNTNLPSNVHTTLNYDPTHAFLDLTLNYSVLGGLNRNQQNVGDTLTNFFNSTGGIPLVFGALSPQGLTQASGETATGTQQTTFDAMNQFMGVMTDPFMAGRGESFGASAPGAPQFADEPDAMAYASNGKRRSKRERDAYAAIYPKAPIPALFAQRWNVWAAGFGGSQTTDGNAAVGSNTATSSIYGVAAGADYWFSPNTVAGFALAGGGTNFSVAGGGSGRSDLFQAGAFVRHHVGAAYLTAAAAYGWQDITTDRTVTANGIERLRANFNANAFSGRLESGYRYLAPMMGGIGLTPYAAAQVTAFDLPAYAEQTLAGASTFALNYAAKDVTASRSELGLRTDKAFALSDAILTLRGRAAWAHNFDADRSIAATFQTLPGASFIVNGAAQADDAALVTTAAEVKWLNGISLAATFEGEFSDVTESYAGKGVVRYAW